MRKKAHWLISCKKKHLEGGRGLQNPVTENEVVMKPLELKSKVAEVLAEKFLRELEQLTSVGREFVDTIRPAVSRLFEELPEEKQVLLMYFLKQSASETGDTSGIDIKRLILEKQIPTETVNLEGFERVRKQVQYIHGVVASTLLVSYGGLGDERIAVEG